MSDLREHFDTPPAQAAPTVEQTVAEPAPVAAQPPPAEVAPAPAPDAVAAEPVVEEAALLAPESRLAPLFSLATLPEAEALPQAVELVNGLESYDPIAHRLLVNSVYQASPNTFRAWVLGDMNIDSSKVDQFMGWLKNGGPQAPALGAFPEIPTEGPDKGWVTLPNGAEVDTNTTEGLERYETQRALHEMRAEKEQTAAAKAADDKRIAEETADAEAQRQYETQMGRATAYATERYAVRDQMIEDAVKPLALEDKFFGDMFRAYAKDHLDNHPELLASSKEASPHVLNGDGRVPEFAAHQEAIIRREMNGLKQNFSLAMLRLNRAERAATATAPQLAPGTRTVESVQAPAPDENVPQTLEQIRREARQIDQQQARGSTR